jgi:membrane associated rhomboid family serine protease
MGIYDREYYRGESTGPGWFNGISPVCKTIIVLNVAIWVLQKALKLELHDTIIRDYLAASPEFTLRHLRLWELLTATFLHADLWHLVGNMWVFWIVGREMESLYGSRDFLAFYLTSAVISSLGWVLIDAASARGEFHLMIGASGAVMATGMLYTLFYPKKELLFIILPMPMWGIMAIYLFYPLVERSTAGTSNVAIESHLTGAAFAFVYKQFDLRWSKLLSGRVFRPKLRIFSPVSYDQARPRTPNPARTTSSVGGIGKPPSVSVLPEEQLDARLDEGEGRAGLTEEEQRVLQEASRRARIRRSDRP